MPLAAYADRTLRSVDSGGDGPVVLCLPSVPLDHTLFDPQVRALEGIARFVRVDLPGIGLTPTWPPGYDLYDIAGDAVALLDALGVERAIVLASGFGAFVALRAALRWPDRIAAMVLIGVQASRPDALTAAGYRGIIDLWSDHGPEPRLADGFAETLFAGLPEVEQIWRARWRTIRRDAIAGLLGAIVDADDISARLGEIRCPTWVMHGTDDGALASYGSQRVAELLPAAPPLELVDRGAHVLSLSHPARVNARVRGFIDDLRGRRA